MMVKVSDQFIRQVRDTEFQNPRNLLSLSLTSLCYRTTAVRYYLYMFRKYFDIVTLKKLSKKNSYGSVQKLRYIRLNCILLVLIS